LPVYALVRPVQLCKLYLPLVCPPHLLLHCTNLAPLLTVALQPIANRMFFLSIPPNVFVQAAGGAADNCSSRCAPEVHKEAQMPYVRM